MNTIHPVILSGGSGTRLWPLSRAMYPKQFIHFFNGQGGSFLGDTLKRLSESDGFAPPILLCNNDHRFLVQEEIERSGAKAGPLILEPMARNTAPAIAVAALVVERQDPDGILVVMPSDHVIRDSGRFSERVQSAARVAATGRLVLFGITPTEAHTGYGYIQRGAAARRGRRRCLRGQGFTEKPDLETARRYLPDGDYLWNSGIFVLHAKTFLEELAEFEPRILAAARAALDGAEHDLGFLRLDGRASRSRRESRWIMR